MPIHSQNPINPKPLNNPRAPDPEALNLLARNPNSTRNAGTIGAHKGNLNVRRGQISLRYVT